MRHHVAPLAAVWSVMALAGEPVAMVGDRPIHEAALDDAVTRALNASYFHRTLAPDKELDLRREQLRGLIRRELDLAGGIDRGLTLDIADAESRRKAMEETLGKEEYERSIAPFGWTRKDHARAIAETLLAEEARRMFVAGPSSVTEKELRRAYDGNPARFMVPETQRVLHIFLRASPEKADGLASREQEARRLARKIRDGASFEEVASKTSEDDYRIKGGDLGFVHRGRLMEPLETESWKARVGEIVGPLRSAEGFHIIRVAERRPERRLGFEEAKERLHKELQERRRQEAEARFHSEVKTRHPVRILQPDLRGAEP